LHFEFLFANILFNKGCDPKGWNRGAEV